MATITERIKEILRNCRTPENDINQIVNNIKADPLNSAMQGKWDGDVKCYPNQEELNEYLTEEIFKASFKYLYIK